jgi:hypothetical protein
MERSAMQIETTKQYCQICGGEVEMPVDTLAALAAAPQTVAEAVAAGGLKTGEGWSPNEVAAHLSDAEVAFGWRLRQTISEDEPELQGWDQERWATAMQYGKRDTEVSLRAYAAARSLNVELLGMLDDAGWERRFRHSEFGLLTLRAMVKHHSDHDLAHLRQIQGE